MITMAYMDGKRVKTSENKQRPRICNRGGSKSSVRMSTGITTGQEVIVLSQEAKKEMLKEALRGAQNQYRGILRTQASEKGGEPILMADNKTDPDTNSPINNKSRLRLFNIRDALSNPSSGIPSEFHTS